MIKRLEEIDKMGQSARRKERCRMGTNFSVENLKIDGLKLITPFYAEDERGFFLKSFEQTIYKNLGLASEVSEEFETLSKKNVIRGLHFQTSAPQIKAVRAIYGEILDVAVDLRKGSSTFGQWESVILSGGKPQIFYIPAGFAHGFCVRSEKALVSYRCFGAYDKATDTGICFSDPELKVDWGILNEKAILSEKDRGLMSFNTFKKRYQGI